MKSINKFEELEERDLQTISGGKYNPYYMWYGGSKANYEAAAALSQSIEDASDYWHKWF